jgi:hypothetical protein
MWTMLFNLELRCPEFEKSNRIWTGMKLYANRCFAGEKMMQSFCCFAFSPLLCNQRSESILLNGSTLPRSCYIVAS